MMKQRSTPQRRLVLQAVSELEGHPSAEEIYQRASQIWPGIGRATVYRCLKLLVAEVRLRRVGLPDAADRYDRQTRPHYHLRCERCGALIDLPVRSGRNLAIIVEIAARNWRLKAEGYNAARELDRRLMRQYKMDMQEKIEG